MKTGEILTRRNIDVQIIDSQTAVIFNKHQQHEIRMTHSGFGPHVNRDDLKAIRDAGAANWSDKEIADIAHHIESRAILSQG